MHRERYVEPLHPIGGAPVPGIDTPVAGLTLATTAQIYPALTNGESVTRHAAVAAESVARHLDAAAGGWTGGMSTAARLASSPY